MPELLTKQESYLLEILPKDVNEAKGFNELFEMTRTFSKEYKIGSRKTFAKALRELRHRGFIYCIEPKVKGRTHKSQYYRTSLGNEYIKSPSQLESSAGIGELTVLKNFVAHPCFDGRYVIYSKIPLLSLFTRDKLEDLVFENRHDITGILSDLEWSLLKKFARAKFGKEHEDQVEENLKFDFFQRRYEGFEIKKKGSGWCKDKSQDAKVWRKIQEILRYVNSGGFKEPITYEDIKYERTTHYHLFEDLPLMREEYREYRKLRKKYHKVMKAYEEFHMPLAVLKCNDDFKDELLLHGPTVKLSDDSIALPEEPLRHLTNKQLRAFENELHEAVATNKYATVTEGVLKRDEEGHPISVSFVMGPSWPRPDDPKAISWPPFNPLEEDWHRDSRKRYFRKVHDAVLREMKRRRLKCKP